MFIGLQSIPLEKEIVSRHGKSYTSFEILPRSVSNVLEMANSREHGQHGFHNHTNIPGFRLAHLQVFGIAVLGIEPMICQDNHLIFKGLDQRVKGSVMHIGSGAIPTTDHPFLVQQPTHLAAHDPATVGISFLPDLLVTTTFPTGMQQLHTIAVHDSQHGWICP